MFWQGLHSSLEKAMAPHSSTLAWKIPWMEEPSGLQSMGSWRIGHDWTISLWLFTFMHRGRKWQPTPVFLAGQSQGQGAWWAAICGVAQSWTQLKWLSSSSSSFASGGQNIGVSASASVLPMNIQDWSPLGWTGWLSLQSKGSQESSPTPRFKSINSSVLSFLYSPTVTSIHD